MGQWFASTASRVGVWTGHPLAFILSFAGILVWVVSGPLFGFSDTWQLVVNTATTVITYLLVFVIQNTQNRDAVAIHLKLDEILRALPEARTELATEHLEQATEEALAAERERLDKLAHENP